jgi:hypothetical protein
MVSAGLIMQIRGAANYAVIEGRPVQDHAENHSPPECLDNSPSSES